MTNIKIAIINQSTALSDMEVSSTVASLQKQVTVDFAPLWGVNAELFLTHKLKTPLANAWQLVILDDSDQADALGYHDLTPNGLPVMKVFAKTASQDGVSWTSVASHEVLEALADPFVDSTIFVETGTTDGRLWPVEVCDPVQGDLYKIGTVEVSNFVTPQWFMTTPPAGSTFDFLKRTTHSFDIRPNGYMEYFDVKNGSGWQQINKDRFAELGG
jgi:hypothetical protein